MRARRIRLCIAIAGVLFAAATGAPAADSTWIGPTDGLWSAPTNWDPQVVPNAVGDVARLEVDLAAPLRIAVNQTVDLGALTFADPADEGITLGTDTLGSIKFDAAGDGPALVAGYGTHECQISATAADDLVFRNTPGEALDLTFSGALSTWADKALRLEGDQVTVTATTSAIGIAGNVEVGPGANVFRLADLAYATNADLFRVHAGSALELDNTLLNREDRVAATVELWGGTFRLIGEASSVTTEYVPQVDVAPGASVVDLQRAGNPPSGVPRLVITRLVGWYGGTVDFRADGFGTTSFVFINYPAGPTLEDGLIGGFARVGPNWASYGAATGVVPLAAYTMNNLLAGGAANVWVNQDELLGGGSHAVNSLKLSAQPDVNLWGSTLYIETGGLLVSDEAAPAGVDTAAIFNGWLSAYPRATGAAAELFVHLLEPLDIAAGIFDYPDTSTLLTASGEEHADTVAENVLTLSGANLYTGSTTIASACVAVDADNRLGNVVSNVFLADGCLRATDTFTTNRQVTVMSNGAFEIADGEILTVGGPLGGSGRALYVRPVPGGGLVPGTVVLAGANTFEADLVVGPAPVAAPAAAGPHAQAAGLDPAVYLQVDEDANLGAPDGQTVRLDGGGLHVTGTFEVDPGRRFLAGPAGAWVRVADGHVFTTAAAGQLAGEGTVTKTGDGKWAVDGANPDFAPTHTVIAQGTVEARHPLALGESPVVLDGGTLALVSDADAVFETPLVAASTGTVHVGGSAAADPVLSVPSLQCQASGWLDVLGEAAYSLAVEGPTTMADGAGLDVQTCDLLLEGGLAATLPAGGVATGTVAPDWVLEIAGEFAVTGDPATFCKMGEGTFEVSGPQNHGPGALLEIQDGLVLLNTDASGTGDMADADLSILVAGGQLDFGDDQHLDTLTIEDGGLVRLTGANAVVVKNLVINGLALGPTTLTPEPATLALLALGAAATIARRRRGR